MSENIEDLKKNMRIRNRLNKDENEKKDKETMEQSINLKEENEKIELLIKEKEEEGREKKEAEEREKEEEDEREKKRIEEEAKLDEKLNKWILQEEIAEKELVNLLNKHPEDFQNVDKFFFSNRMSNLYQKLATKKAVQKLQFKENLRRGKIMKKNKPFIMKLM